MGQSLDVYAGYGHALGAGTDGPWRVVEVTEDGDLDRARLSWLPLRGEDEDHWGDEDDVETLLEQRLRRVVGGLDPEDGWERDGFYDRLRVAEAKIGVELGHPGVDAWEELVLLATGSCRHQEYGALELGDLTVDPAWDAHLDGALAALGLTPTTPRGWLAYASYG